MRLWQGSRITRLLNGEPSRSVRALQIFKPVDRNTRRSSGKLKKTRLLFGVPAADDLPEVLDNLVLLLVTTVVGVLLPVVHVNIGDTTNEQLQFTLIENIDKIRGNQLVEPGHESVELLFDSLDNLPFRDQSDGILVQHHTLTLDVLTQCTVLCSHR